MGIFPALVLGLVAGLATFFPISAPAHLILVAYLFGWKPPSAAFEIAAYAGALVALGIVFRERITSLRAALKQPDHGERHVLTMIVTATVPAAIVAIGFAGAAQVAWARPVAVSLLLGVTGYALINGERFMAEHEERLREEATVARRAKARGEEIPAVHRLKEEQDLSATDAVFIGAAQGFSAFPGISRTGASLAAAMHAGLSRETAVRFSYLLAIPALAGAMILQIPPALKAGLHGQPVGMIIGVAASAFAGVFAIRTFTRVFLQRGLRLFAFYCFAMMVAGLLTALARG